MTVAEATKTIKHIEAVQAVLGTIDRNYVSLSQDHSLFAAHNLLEEYKNLLSGSIETAELTVFVFPAVCSRLNKKEGANSNG